MKITDCAYMARMKHAALYPALTPLEAAMLPARQPTMGALAHAKKSEAEKWRLQRPSPGRNMGYLQKICVR